MQKYGNTAEVTAKDVVKLAGKMANLPQEVQRDSADLQAAATKEFLKVREQPETKALMKSIFEKQI